MSLEGLLTQLCTAEPYAGAGAFGPVYGPTVPLACRVEDVTQVVRDSTGTEVISTATLFVGPGVTLPGESRVTLPSGRVTTVIEVARPRDRNAEHHLEVKLR